MSDDDLRQLFDSAREEVADAGFARRVAMRIARMRMRRRLVLGAAAATGALIAVPALLRAHEFVVPIVWTPAHAAGQLFGVIALSAGAIAVWLLSLAAEE